MDSNHRLRLVDSNQNHGLQHQPGNLKHPNSNAHTVVGAGFHPRADNPHANVFALFQAAGLVESGVVAARAVVKVTHVKHIQALTEQYNGITSQGGGGSQELIGGIFLEDAEFVLPVEEGPRIVHVGRPP